MNLQFDFKNYVNTPVEATVWSDTFARRSDDATRSIDNIDVDAGEGKRKAMIIDMMSRLLDKSVTGTSPWFDEH